MKTTAKFTNYAKKLTLLALLVCSSGISNELFGQQFNIGADIMSRYVWRGADFGNSPSIQPSVSFSSGIFEIGAWAAYPTSFESAEVSENDLYASLTFETDQGGSFGVGVTDYYFPNGGQKFFNYDNGGNGAHFIEPNISYSGPSSFPISFYGGFFVHNEPDNSIYLELSYPFSLDGTDITIFGGGTPQESGFYGTNKAGIINTGLSVSREIKITEAFSIPLTGSYILDAYHENAYLVFGFSL